MLFRSAGSGQVRVAPDSETGGKVIVEETVRGGSCPVMVCEVEDGTLSVSYMEGHGGLSGCSQSWFGQKDLTVTVPASLGEKLELFGLEAASGRYTVENLNCGELELGVASGEVDMTGLAAKRAELSVASGRVHVQGAITENIGLGRREPLAARRSACGGDGQHGLRLADVGAARRHAAGGRGRQDERQLQQRVCEPGKWQRKAVQPLFRHD